MKAESETTTVIQGEATVLRAIIDHFSRAKSRLDLSVSVINSQQGASFIDALRSAREQGTRTRLVTEVTADNLKAVRAASAYLEVRHVAGLKGNAWSVIDDEYVSSLAVGEFSPLFPVIYSNAHSLVAEHQSIFDALWNMGEPLEERVKALEAGTDLPEVEIIRETARIKELYLSLVKRAKSQLLLLLPTPAAFRRDDEIGVIAALEGRASKGVKVKLLTPVDGSVLAELQQKALRTGHISFRQIPTAGTSETVTLLVVDKLVSLTIDERAPGERDFDRAVGSALLATGEPRVRQSIRFFERIWTENELREAEQHAKEREEKSRRRAELMQDILTHDIRNFNQVARLNAELLGEEITDQESSTKISAILRAVDGSTRLIERAKKLGGILSAGPAKLHPVSLKTSFERSKSLVSKGNPKAKVKLDSSLSGYVLADELLDEVFVNILSNAVKYTAGGRAHIDVRQEPGELRFGPGGGATPCWRICISDHGRGIPDAEKPTVFKRYLETAKGSGLGLSIVHALVTERYAGKVELKNRVSDDFTKGTTVEVWLPKP